MKSGRRGQESSKNIGNFYEHMAADYLEKQGYCILEKNFRSPKGEIDIIAK
ncbi:MAG TPA: YraN family protein, partial [Candidatus Blautia stercoripullorum]|nr:YraN family protein [Candidatus Blautia stercoripullorum]